VTRRRNFRVLQCCAEAGFPLANAERRIEDVLSKFIKRSRKIRFKAFARLISGKARLSSIPGNEKFHLSIDAGSADRREIVDCTASCRTKPHQLQMQQNCST
jgi:hypothetical protein